MRRALHSRTFASSRAICADPSDLTCRKGMLSRLIDFYIISCSRLTFRSFGRKAPNFAFIVVLAEFLDTPMLSFVLLQLEPLFRYDSREWSGESNPTAGLG
ncbi:BQ5605_C004g03097 [Microbotryum silenes-dioicae]|uniref:BQ5605_C004g03097 protein n=1 Tax=Microbotryum silenes-dioicae TaxID=796604 RepID=A0A2X0MDV6_9BASI|nr:BQ5605_C004g03097 [Microbotryum silenes-dioicae]